MSKPTQNVLSSSTPGLYFYFLMFVFPSNFSSFICKCTMEQYEFCFGYHVKLIPDITKSS